MIARLHGTVLSQSQSALVLDVHGVGYEVICSLGVLSQLHVGEEATLIIFTEMRENSIRLFGFTEQLEKTVFLFLMQVKGVGAKSASEMLSGIDPRELLRLIASGDVVALQKVKGIGKKTAERILVELKDRVMDQVGENRGVPPVLGSSGAADNDALAALEALGFRRAEAQEALQQALKELSTNDNAPGELVKQALRYI